MPPTSTAPRTGHGRPPTAVREGRSSPCPRGTPPSPSRSAARPPTRHTSTPGSATPGSRELWWALITRPGREQGERSLVGVDSAEFPHGTPVDATSGGATERRPARWVVDVRYRSRDGAPLHVAVAGPVGAPDVPLWFVPVHDGSDLLPATSLVAFSAAGVRPGRVVAPHEAAARGLLRTDRVAEIRWCPRSGVVDTVVVEASVRGRGIGRHLVTAAEGLRTLWGWPPLRSDGRLTDAGAQWLTGSPGWWRPRLGARTERLPATPDGTQERLGVARLLA